MSDPPFNIVLVQPEIPPNTGSVARLCGATNTTLHLVKPLGFKTDDKHLKRAGLDYWKFVDIVYWQNLEELLAAIPRQQMKFFSKKVTTPYTSAQFKNGDFLIFGRETKGLPEELIDRNRKRSYAIPMENPGIRSLNLAMSCGIILYEAIRQAGQTEEGYLE